MLANVKRAMAITANLNRLTFNDGDEVRALFSDLIGKKVDERFRLIPPFYTANGLEIRIGHRVFINQNCTLYDLAEIRIGDDVMIGPNVSILTASHPVARSERRAYVVARPIVIAPFDVRRTLTAHPASSPLSRTARVRDASFLPIPPIRDSSAFLEIR